MHGITVLLWNTEGKLLLAPAAGGKLRPMPLKSNRDRLAGEASDANLVYLYRASHILTRLYEVNRMTGWGLTDFYVVDELK
jgi:hypothetical protein